MGHRTLLPSEMTASQIYDALSGLVVPRPIALVSTHDGEGGSNLAPFSFFTPGGVNPPSLAFSATLNMHGGPKDTLANIDATGEFTVNLVDRSMAEGMNQASMGLPRHVSEWSIAGFSGADGVHVGSCRVVESPAAFECKLFRIVHHGTGPSAAAYVIGEVVAMFVDERLMDSEERRLLAIGRLAKHDYVDLAKVEPFTLSRP